MLVVLGNDLKNVKLLFSLLLLMLATYFKPGKRSTYSPVGKNASLVAQHHVEHFIFVTAHCDAFLSPCLLFILVDSIHCGELPSLPTEGEISGVQVWLSWCSACMGHAHVSPVNVFV